MSAIWKQEINLIQWTYNFIKLHMRCCDLDHPDYVQDVIPSFNNLYISYKNSDF